jgi:tRNA(adenine34) deaminase
VYFNDLDMTDIDEKDVHFMREALKEAHYALSRDEVPIGAIVVLNDRIVARAHNLTEALNDATAHAEMQALTAAANTIGGKYLDKCTLYVTVEPCPMCASAAYWTHLGRLVYGTTDPKRGYQNIGVGLLHPRTEVKGGVLNEDCAALMTNFFKNKRQKLR